MTYAVTPRPTAKKKKKLNLPTNNHQRTNLYTSHPPNANNNTNPTTHTQLAGERMNLNPVWERKREAKNQPDQPRMNVPFHKRGTWWSQERERIGWQWEWRGRQRLRLAATWGDRQYRWRVRSIVVSQEERERKTVTEEREKQIREREINRYM